MFQGNKIQTRMLFARFLIFLNFLNFLLSIDTNAIFSNSIALKRESQGSYYVVGDIGTPPQRINLKIALFSSNFTINCFDNGIFVSDLQIYIPQISTSKNNSSLLNGSVPEQFFDILRIGEDYLIENFSITCTDTKENTYDLGFISIMSEVFYSQESPYIYVCFYEHGGFIKHSNLSLNSGYLQAAGLSSTEMIFTQSVLNNSSLIITNLGIVTSGGSQIVNFIEGISNFEISFGAGIQYHLFSSNLFLKLKHSLNQAFFGNFETFENDNGCFFIKNLQSMMSSMPVLVFVFNNSESLELRTEDYLTFYFEQNICCFNFKENLQSEKNLFSMIMLKNRLIKADFLNKRMTVVDFDCQNSDLAELFGLINVPLDFNTNEIFINMLIAFLSLGIFLCGLVWFVKLKEFLQRRDAASPKNRSPKKHTNKKQKIQINYTISDKNRGETKINFEKKAKIPEEEEQKKENIATREEKKEVTILKDFDRIDKIKLKERFLKTEKKKKKKLNEKKI